MASDWVLLILSAVLFYLQQSNHNKNNKKKMGVKILKKNGKGQKISQSLNDRSDFTDYVEENSLSFQAGPRNLDLRCPKALWKMCVKTRSEPLGIFKMDEHKPYVVCLYFDPALHSFRDPFFSLFYHLICSYMYEFQNVDF